MYLCKIKNLKKLYKMVSYYYYVEDPKDRYLRQQWDNLYLDNCGLGIQLNRDSAEALDVMELKGKSKEGREVDCPYKVLGGSKNLAVFSEMGGNLVAKAGISTKSNGQFEIMVLCGESVKARNAGKNLMHHIFQKLGKDCGKEEVNQEGQLVSTNNPFYDKLDYLEQTLVDSDDEDRAVYEGTPKLNSPAAMGEYPEVTERESGGTGIYKIKKHTKVQAKKLGVEVKPSQLKNKKIDVFRGGRKVASVGHPDYKDYPTFLQDCSKKVADTRRELYKKRHEKTRHKKDSPSYFADKLLW